MFLKIKSGWLEVWNKYWKVFVGLVYNLKESLSRKKSLEINKSKNCISLALTIFNFKFRYEIWFDLKLIKTLKKILVFWYSFSIVKYYPK